MTDTSEPGWYRGTNGFRVAWCIKFNNAQFTADEPAAMRVGDESKGFLSHGISMSRNKRILQKYARKSSDEILPSYAACIEWLSKSGADKQRFLRVTWHDKEDEDHEELYNLVSAMIIWQNRYDVTTRGGRRAGGKLYIKESSEGAIITRCDDFCTQVTSKLNPSEYDKIKEFSQVGVIVCGSALGQAPDVMGYRAGMLGDEIRRPAMAIESVEIVSGPVGAAARFEAIYSQLTGVQCTIDGLY